MRLYLLYISEALAIAKYYKSNTTTIVRYVPVVFWQVNIIMFKVPKPGKLKIIKSQSTGRLYDICQRHMFNYKVGLN